MIKRMIGIFSGSALLIAAAVAVVVASRNRQQPAPPPKVPIVTAPVEVRVKAVERNSVDAKVATAAFHNKTASSAGKCGIIFPNESNADKCEEERMCERAHRPVHDILAL
jgi:hypothetical protein